MDKCALKKLEVDRFPVKNRGENLRENFFNLIIKESPNGLFEEPPSESLSICRGHTFQAGLAMKLNHGRDLK
jgi:hypothetical protein